MEASKASTGNLAVAYECCDAQVMLTQTIGEFEEKLTKLINEFEKKYNAYVLKFDPQVLYDEKLDKLYLDAGYKTSGYKPDVDQVIQPLHDGVLKIKDKTEDELMKYFNCPQCTEKFKNQSSIYNFGIKLFILNVFISVRSFIFILLL